MIYDFPGQDEPIRQGDIFFSLPRADFSLSNMIMATETEERQVAWEEVAEQDQVQIIVSVRPVSAIVVSQDCDALRSKDLTLCEINSFKSVEGKAAATSSPKAWVSLIMQQARVNQKWYYLVTVHGLAICPALPYTVAHEMA